MKIIYFDKISIIIHKYIIMESVNNKKSWGLKKKSTISDFFHGINIITQIENSNFGKIKNTVNEVFDNEDMNQYILPTVIVIGCESTGKSSLLENITKCQIFPRDSKICTKCPIKVKLTNSINNQYSIEYNNKNIILNKKEDIYTNICNIMHNIPDDTILDNEIIINITENKLPTFEFYDLPGIRAYPPKMTKQTTELYKKYLENENSIILCVVPATTPRLTSCQSIALINEMGMEQHTILALTMCDRLLEDNIEELLVKRIINLSDEVQNLNFAGYVGVLNRTHLDMRKLDENDTFEKKWFTENIINNIPDDYQNYKNEIINNLTISNLIIKIDNLYNDFIYYNWKPKIINKLCNKLKKLKVNYDDLGLPIEQIPNYMNIIKQTIKNLMYNLINNLNDYLFFDPNYIKSTIVLHKIKMDYSYTSSGFFNAIHNIDDNNKHILVNKLYNTIKFIIENFISKLSEIDTIKYYDINNINDEENNDKSDENDCHNKLINIKFIRFNNIMQKITQFYNDIYEYNTFINKFDNILEKYSQMKLYHYALSMDNSFNDIQIFNRLIYTYYFSDLPYPQIDVNDFIENPSYILQRKEITEKIIIVEKHLDKINNLLPLS
jgi:GTP-binding protein EngB required for normal cell division